jgi:hypothetical protein
VADEGRLNVRFDDTGDDWTMWIRNGSGRSGTTDAALNTRRSLAWAE